MSSCLPGRAASRWRFAGNFIELCEQLTLQDGQALEELWRRLSLSANWPTTYPVGAGPRRELPQGLSVRSWWDPVGKRR
ncbi:MAG: hypothetical protein ACRDUV_04830 [Pseudonocardiaceae bacterium]